MTIDFEKVAEAIEKNPQEIKDLMFSTELGEKIMDIAEKNNLDEDTGLKFVDEIGYVILDLKPKSVFFDSLVEIGIEKSVAMTVTREVENKIFTELDKIKSKVTPNINISISKSAQQNVGQSFEQIILNQARAMQPARESSQVPANLPIEKESEMPIQRPIEREKDSIQPTQNREVHNYSSGNDPYREPIS